MVGHDENFATLLDSRPRNKFSLSDPVIKTTGPEVNDDERATVFAFFSNRLGCLGSIAVSVIGTVLLIVLMRGCHL